LATIRVRSGSIFESASALAGHDNVAAEQQRGAAGRDLDRMDVLRASAMRTWL
jgi:hypothetical protein